MKMRRENLNVLHGLIIMLFAMLLAGGTNFASCLSTRAAYGVRRIRPASIKALRSSCMARWRGIVCIIAKPMMRRAGAAQTPVARITQCRYWRALGDLTPGRRIRWRRGAGQRKR